LKCFLNSFGDCVIKFVFLQCVFEDYKVVSCTLQMSSLISLANSPSVSHFGCVFSSCFYKVWCGIYWFSLHSAKMLTTSWLHACRFCSLDFSNCLALKLHKSYCIGLWYYVWVLSVCHCQVFVETLDKCFENVCELDLIFHVDKVMSNYLWSLHLPEWNIYIATWWLITIIILLSVCLLHSVTVKYYYA